MRHAIFTVLVYPFHNNRKFEQLAINVVDECFEANETLAEMLIDRPYECWGGKNSVTMAAEAGSQVNK